MSNGSLCYLWNKDGQKSGSDIGFDKTVACSSDNPGLSLQECTVFVARILAFHSHYLIQEQTGDLCL